MSNYCFYDYDVFVDYYNMLNLEMNATSDDIKKSYFSLVKKHHPDQGGSEALFRKITEAYEILSDKNSRREYDSYYLRGDTNNYLNDELLVLKNGYQNYIDENVKELNEDEKEKLYFDIIKSIQNDNKKIVDEQLLNSENMLTNFENLNLDRKNAMIEEQDDSVFNLINKINSQKKPDEYQMTINDVFDYYKHKQNKQNQSTQLVNMDFLTLSDINDPMTSNYNFIDPDQDNKNSTLFSFYNDMHTSNKDDLSTFIKEMNENDFLEWKNENDKIIINTPVVEEDFDNLIRRRKQEGIEIKNTIESNLNRYKQVLSNMDNSVNQFDESNGSSFFSNDVYDYVMKIDSQQQKHKDVNDIRNFDDDLQVNINSNDINELKKIAKLGKNNFEKNECNSVDTEMKKYLKSRHDDNVSIPHVENKYDYKSSKYDKPVNNIIKRNAKPNAKPNNNVYSDYQMSSTETESKLRQMINSNNKNSVKQKYDVELDNDLGNVSDYLT